MKFAEAFLAVAFICSASAAVAQTKPTPTTPSLLPRPAAAAPATPARAAPMTTAANTTLPPVGAEPTTTTASYGDWVLRCQKFEQAGAPPKVCEVAQSIQVQGQNGPIAQIAIGTPPGESSRVTIILPTSVTFPSSVKLTVGDKEGSPLELAWRRCFPGGCFADATLGADLVRIWRNTSDAGQIAFTDASGQVVKLPLSFRGLAQALDALSRG